MAHLQHLALAQFRIGPSLLHFGVLTIATRNGYSFLIQMDLKDTLKCILNNSILLAYMQFIFHKFQYLYLIGQGARVEMKFHKKSKTDIFQF